MKNRSRDAAQRWPERDGYRAVERMADVALMPADEVPDTPVEWLWPDTIPLGHLTLVAGEPGSGKSFFTTDLAARVTVRGDWPHRPPAAGHAGRDGTEAPHATQRVPGEGYGGPAENPTTGSVLFVNSDDSFDDVQQPRLAAAEAQRPLVGLMRRMPPGSRFAQFNSVGPVCDRLQAVKAAIKEAGDCKLAIIDDLAHFVRDGLGKATRGDLMLALGSLKCIAGECNVAILVVWRLERTGRATAKYLESFLPSAAMAWLVGNDPYRTGQRWMVSLKNHFGPPCEPMAFHIADNRVVWDEPPASVPADVMAAFVRKGDRRLEREQAGRWALERLAEGPLEANELFGDGEAFGFSRRTLRRALVDLGLKPTKCGDDGSWLWSVGDRGQGAVTRRRRMPMFRRMAFLGRPNLTLATRPLGKAMLRAMTLRRATSLPLAEQAGYEAPAIRRSKMANSRRKMMSSPRRWTAQKP
jgi:putative DNA primase/helicase